LCPVKAAALSVLMPMQLTHEIYSAVKLNHCLEYFTPCTSFWKQQTEHELFLDVFFETVSDKYK
jgi:hypothetical protein